MRKITKKAGQALLDGKSYTGNNTYVEVYENGDRSMFLFNNEIAKFEGGSLYVCFQGWGSVTTKERINGLIALSQGCEHGSRFYVKDYTMLDSDGSAVDLNTWIKID